jgi:DNA-binding MarR family transcriptional regulator
MVTDLEIVEKILETLGKVSSMDRKRRFHFEDINLYHSELHLLLFVYSEQNTNITLIAQKIGLTKGAVSQTLSRLENKGIITKQTDPYRKNELKVMFTEKGKALMREVVKIKENAEQKYVKYISSLSYNEKMAIYDFMDWLGMMHNKNQ